MWTSKGDAIVLGALDTWLGPPVVKYPSKVYGPVSGRTSPRTSVPIHLLTFIPLDTSIAVPSLFDHDRPPDRGGLLEEGLIYVHMFHTRPGTSRTICLTSEI